MAELARTVAELHGLPRAAARAINISALVRYSAQDWAGARGLFHQALERARAECDDELIGLACQNLGVLANIRGELREARILYLESIGSAIRTRSERNALMAYNNLAMVCCDLEGWLEAELYFDRGIEIAERVGDLPMLARLWTNRAEPLLKGRQVAQALDSLERGERILDDLEDPGTRADLRRFRATALRLQGELDAAAAELERAFDSARQAGADLAEAEITLELARLHHARGDGAAALRTAKLAGNRFRALGADGDAVAVEALLASWGTAGEE